MNDSHLLVPVHLDCLAVNRSAAAGRWSRPVAKYSKLERMENPAPDPTEQHTIEIGVHLHWALPDALTQGRQARHGSGGITFPLVPNRWLVVRRERAEPNSWKAWLVESDYLGPDGMSPFVDPDSGRDGEPPEPTGIGRIHVLHPAPDTSRTWQGRLPEKPFLRAIGPGDPAFAAWQPGVYGVFGLHDDLLDAGRETRESIDLTYTVLGWYARADDDPVHNLSPRALERKLATFGWAIEGEPPTTAPAGLVCHGTRFGVRWHTFEQPARPNSDPSRWAKIEVAVGNTGVDGLAALLEARARANPKVPEGSGALVAELFEAVQYGALPTLEEPGGIARLDHEIRNHWFGSRPGGVRWAITAAEDREETDGPPAAPPPMTAAERVWLADLNRNQRHLDAARRRLESLQWDVYAYWWKIERTKTWKRAEWRHEYPDSDFPTFYPQLELLLGSEGADDPKVETAIGLVQAEQAEVRRLEALVPALEAAQRARRDRVAAAAATKRKAEPGTGEGQSVDVEPPDEIAEAIGEWLDSSGNTLTPGLKLEAQAAPRFWHPNDPVLVVSGLERAKKHGEDGRYRADGRLLCRWPSQVLTQFAGGSPAPRLDAQELDAALGGAPEPCRRLLDEAFVLEPGNSELFGIDRKKVEALTAAPGQAPGEASARDEPAERSALLSERALVPSPVGASPWSQAWVPLVLEWAVRFYPTAHLPAEDWMPISFDPGVWRFSSLDGGPAARGGPDYRYGRYVPGEDGGAASGTYEPGKYEFRPMFLSGRTFLTPQVEHRFSEEIKKYVEEHPPSGTGAEALESFLDGLKKLDVLSQSLSGFNDQLIMRRSEATLPPPESMSTWIGDQYHSVPDPAAGNVGFDKPFFLPVRGGFFHFVELRVVDAFGQVVDLLAANHPEQVKVGGDSWEGFRPHRGRGLIPSEPTAAFGKFIDPKPARERLVVLPPRVVQPARLDFDLLDGRSEPLEGRAEADVCDLVADAEPVCGWLVPNHLDNALSVYDSEGFLLGELIEQTRKVGGKDATRADWLPAPGVDDPIEDPREPPDASARRPGIENRYLRGFVSSLLPKPTDASPAASGKALEGLLDAIDSTLWTVDPLGGRGDQNLSVLIGRPLALVRARLALSLHGEPVRDQSWMMDFIEVRPEAKGLAKEERRKNLAALTGGLVGKTANPRFDVKLGEPELRQDGLMGYYMGEDFSRFFALHPSQSGKKTYVQPSERSGLTLSFREDDCQVVTMLIDPRGSVHAATGMLPVRTVELPGERLEKLLAGFRVTFRAGPVLSDADALRLPRPAERQGTWGWVERVRSDRAEAPEPMRWVEEPIVDLGHQARLAERRPVLREGWLQLSEATPKLSYALTGAPLRAGEAGAGITIEIAAKGDEAVECSSIDFVIPLGSGATALTESLADAAVEVASPEWSVEAVHGHRYVVRPPAGKVPPPDIRNPIELKIDGVRVSEAAGTARIFVVEGTRGRPTASLAVTKQAKSKPKTGS